MVGEVKGVGRSRGRGVVVEFVKNKKKKSRRKGGCCWSEYNEKEVCRKRRVQGNLRGQMNELAGRAGYLGPHISDIHVFVPREGFLLPLRNAQDPTQLNPDREAKMVASRYLG